MGNLILLLVALGFAAPRAQAGGKIFDRPAGPYVGDDSPNPCYEDVNRGVDLVYDGEVKLNDSVPEGIAMIIQGADLIRSCPTAGNPCEGSLRRGLDLIDTGRAFLEGGPPTIPSGLANIDAGRHLIRGCPG